MELLASGRDSDVYACGDALVLRRYRDGRSAEEEAATIRAVAALGYPVPTVHRAVGPDIVMQRVEGPTLAGAMFDGLRPESVGRTLAELHDRLHALDWPAAGAGDALLHLDLHPLNVIMAEPSPVVIDWSNARPGPAALDVAMTVLILAQVVVADDVLSSVGVAVPAGFDQTRMRSALTEVLRTFTGRVGTSYRDQLAAAEDLRRRDPLQSRAEVAALPQARDFAATLT